MILGHSGTAIAIAATWATVTAAGGARLTPLDAWYRALRKPSWQPPDWLFGPAWSLIFLLGAFAFVLAWDGLGDGGARARLLALYALNSGLNLLWSYLFFVRRRPDLALGEAALLLASVVALIVTVAPVDVRAAWAFAPYAAWVSFAMVLNATIVRLNPRNVPAGRRMA